jgi:hypothetical protein
MWVLRISMHEKAVFQRMSNLETKNFKKLSSRRRQTENFGAGWA